MQIAYDDTQFQIMHIIESGTVLELPYKPQ